MASKPQLPHIVTGDCAHLAVVSKQVAIRLMSDLKRKKIARINIDTIRVALMVCGNGKLTKSQRDYLETETLRHLVESVG